MARPACVSAGNVHAGFDSTADNNVAVYWGQNSYGQGTGPLAQQRLSYYCQTERTQIFPLAFMTVIHDQYGEPEINFANAGNNCTTFAGTALLDCGQLAEDIPTCQALNKTILLSIGGATYTEGGFSTPDAAVAAAKVVWNTFGPVNPSSNALRPFGNAAVDGFDFDFEAGVTNMAPFANELRSLMDTTTTQDGVHRFLTAAPQCPYPDYADNQILNGSVYVDAVFVQFYNNYCGLQSFTPSSSTQNNFNFATWDNWASTVSRNPAVKVLLGIPANTGAAGSGYEPPSTLQPIIDYCKQFKSFGGVMMWDSSQQEANTGFTAAVKGFLGRDQEDDTCKAAREGMRPYM
ncbi:glycoside hydrolase family 18 protein [Saccharata proteae CBS 121410]|uniref:chitinase n=1 Tax=Saccharata proteae CBS 121410 TaxID=1314787 RepID=A0A9P4HT63_9PEZI|nr:glycoside hydrolase family 18 protein [Saccharata proteae CBS 121410]